MIEDDFYTQTEEGAPFDTSFTVTQTGLYDLQLAIWDVGGGHHEKRDLQFYNGRPENVDERTDLLRPALGRGRPNPTGEGVIWPLRLQDQRPARVRVIRPDGRCIRDLGSRTCPGAASSVVWDGRDDRGRRVPAGKYFLTVDSSGGQRLTNSVIIVR